jgi:hypothetical protein
MRPRTRRFFLDGMPPMGAKHARFTHPPLVWQSIRKLRHNLVENLGVHQFLEVVTHVISLGGQRLDGFRAPTTPQKPVNVAAQMSRKVTMAHATENEN